MTKITDARLDELIAGRMFVAEEARDALRSYRSLRARHKEAVGLLRRASLALQIQDPKCGPVEFGRHENLHY